MKKLTANEKAFGVYHQRPHVKERINRRMRENREIARELGRCTTCLVNDRLPNRSFCEYCRIRNQVYQKRYQDKKRSKK